MKKFGSFLIFSILAGSASAAFGGVLLNFEDKPPKGESARASRFFMEGKKLRVENSKGGVMLFDGDQQKLWTIDPDRKNYSEVTEADVAQIEGMRRQMEDQMKEQMSKMPPERRKRMEEMMERHGAGPSKERELTFEATGKEKKTDHGFLCKLYRVLEEGKEIEEACFIPWKEAGLSVQDFQAFDAFGAFLKKIGGDAKHQNRVFHDLTRAPGIPAHTAVIRPDGSTGSEQELTELKRENIPAAQFTLPAGLEKKPLFEKPGPGYK